MRKEFERLQLKRKLIMKISVTNRNIPILRARSFYDLLVESFNKMKSAGRLLINKPSFGNKIWVAIGGDKQGCRQPNLAFHY